METNFEPDYEESLDGSAGVKETIREAVKEMNISLLKNLAEKPSAVATAIYGLS